MATTYEEQARQEREKRLKDRLQQDVPAPAFEALWRHLLEDKHIQDGRPQHDYEDLKDDAERVANIQREAFAETGGYSGTRPGRTPRQEEADKPPEVELTEYEERCARTYSKYLGILAAKRPDVLQFRAFTLGCVWPTGKETDEKLKDLASGALLSPGKALAWARSEKCKDPGSGLQLRYAADDDAEIFDVEVLRNSVLDRLRVLSEKLAGILPWHPADTARWLLTGIPVKVSPIWTSRYRNDDVITMTALPFVDARTVTTSYRKMQRQLKGGDNQRVGGKALDVLLFVEQRTSFRGERSGWGALLKEWNARHPSRVYKNREDLQQARKRAHVALIGREPPAAWR